VAKALELAIPIICAHKGFGAGSRWASPEDVPRAAKLFPDAKFIVYHSGFERVGPREGPYTRATAHLGINRLIRAMKREGNRPERERLRGARLHVVDGDAGPRAGGARDRKAAQVRR
jgi:hypothetical protein